MAYVKKNWQNTPSTNTPINADNLNHMEQGIYDAAETADYAKDKVDDLQGLVYSPLVAATAAAMTDTTKVYVYTGSETGYTFGHWYYYNGTAWADGGVYNSTAFNTDATLSHQGEAADAKAAGDAIGNLNNALTASANFKGGTALTSGADLNDIKTVASYYANGTVAASLSNCPITHTFRMFVMQTTDLNTNRLQIIYDLQDAKTYVRLWTTSWTDWVGITYSDEFNKLKGQAFLTEEGTEIVSSTDLNDLTTVGSYFAGSGVLSSLVHKPTNSIGSFRMFVLKTSAMNGNRTQLLIDTANGTIYFRTYTSSWSDWNKVASISDVNSLISSSESTMNDKIDGCFKIQGGTALTDGQDLNDITTVGNYYCSNAVSKTLSNIPEVGTARIFVFKSTDANTNRFQLYVGIENGNSNIYRRIYSSGAWSAWVKFDANIDVLEQINACANYGRSGEGVVNKYKNFSMLITTDVHADQIRFNRAIDLIEKNQAIECGICLGDMAGSNYAESDGTWYTNAVNSLTKPFYTVIGNHDGGNGTSKTICGTKEQVFQKFVYPTIGRIGIPNLDKTYYRIDFDNYKLTLIVLDNYDAPDTTDSNGDFIISRGVECFSQAQIDWFIGELANIPSSYHLLIARHSGAGATWSVDLDSLWTCHEDAEIEESAMRYSELPINDIVEAWRNGTTLTKSYAPISQTEYLPTISVNADFTSRGNGIFACYIVGHHHADVVAKDANNQKIFEFDCTSVSAWVNFRSDLPRVANTDSQDLTTLIGVNTDKRVVKLVRIGSRNTTDMTTRDMLLYKY